MDISRGVESMMDENMWELVLLALTYVLVSMPKVKEMVHDLVGSVMPNVELETEEGDLTPVGMGLHGVLFALVWWGTGKDLLNLR